MKTRSIYLLLTNTKTLFTRCIKCFTQADYNHISIAFDSELNELYSFGRKSMVWPLFSGFVQENIQNGIYKLKSNTSCLLMKLNVTKKEWRSIRQAVDHFISNENLYKYNLIGLVGFLINREINRSNAFFCSQFVATVLKNVEDPTNARKPGLTAPHDFLAIPNKHIVYEGLLRNYRQKKSMLLAE